MSSTKHRTTGDPTADLTPEQRHLASERALVRIVGTACDRWLRSRGIGPGRLFTYDGPVQAAGCGKDGLIQATAEDGTGGAGSIFTR